jgi:phosphatidylglycerol:prolipoprotein diacylglycerol transferase
MHPVLFRLGPLDIHTYGVLVAVGFLLGLTIAGRRAQREGIESRHVSDLGIWLILAGMGGAKIFHIVFFWNEFIGAWRAEGIRSLREGFVFYGGFLAAIATTIYFAHQRKLPLWKFADILTPTVALGHAFGRLGCFFNGCCFGAPSHAPWALRYPDEHIAHGLPVHPTQLYEVAGNLVLFFVLSAWLPRRRFDGQIWWWYVLAYGALRFAIEFLRGDYEVHYFGVFTIAHVIAAGLMLTAAVALGGLVKWRGELRRS